MTNRYFDFLRAHGEKEVFAMLNENSMPFYTIDL